MGCTTNDTFSEGRKFTSHAVPLVFLVLESALEALVVDSAQSTYEFLLIGDTSWKWDESMKG